MISHKIEPTDFWLELICGTALLAYCWLSVEFLNGHFVEGINPGSIAVMQLRWSMLTLTAGGFLIHLVLLLLDDARPRSLIQWLDQYGAQWIRYAFLFFCLVAALATYTSVKQAILLVSGNAVDVYLMKIMRYLGFGKFPWQRLQPLLGHPLVTVAIDRIYTLGIGIVFWLTACFAVMQRRKPHLGEQYILAYALVIALLGSLLAFRLASAGPCFYGRMGLSPDPYVPLMGYLRGVDAKYGLYAVSLQDKLWAAYIQHGSLLGGGISAMPSMHMALATLAALAVWQINWRAGGIAWAFTLTIYLGGIHLAWHYAADGLVSLVATFLLWNFAGWIVAQVCVLTERSRVNPST